MKIILRGIWIFILVLFGIVAICAELGWWWVFDKEKHRDLLWSIDNF